MYTLRRISKEGHESNLFLGNNYTFISKDTAEEAFKRVYKDAYLKLGMVQNPHDDCYALIQSQNESYIFLWKGESNYIMNESGKTFSNLTFK